MRGWSVPEIGAELKLAVTRVSDEKYKALRKLEQQLGNRRDELEFGLPTRLVQRVEPAPIRPRFVPVELAEARTDHRLALIASSTAALWPSTLTLGKIFRTIPRRRSRRSSAPHPCTSCRTCSSLSRRRRLRRPCFSASARSVNGRSNFLANLAWDSGVVGADAENDRAGFLVVGEGVAKAARLLGAAGRIVLGIEIEDDRRTLELGERHRLAVLVGQREVGGGLAFFHHGSCSDTLDSSSSSARRGLVTPSCSCGRRTADKSDRCIEGLAGKPTIDFSRGVSARGLPASRTSQEHSDGPRRDVRTYRRPGPPGRRRATWRTCSRRPATGLFDVIVANRDEVRVVENRAVVARGRIARRPAARLAQRADLPLRDPASALHAGSTCTLDESGRRLEATIGGEPIDRDRHVLDHEVKAATHHGLSLRPRGRRLGRRGDSGYLSAARRTPSRDTILIRYLIPTTEGTEDTEKT